MQICHIAKNCRVRSVNLTEVEQAETETPSYESVYILSAITKGLPSLLKVDGTID